MPIAPGVPRIEDHIKQNAAAARFIEACRYNQPEAATRAFWDAATPSVPSASRSGLYSSGLAAAAENGAIDVIRAFHVHDIRHGKIGQAETIAWNGAFITACRHNQFAIVEYLYHNIHFAPGIIAWGHYRAPEQSVSKQWLKNLQYHDVIRMSGKFGALLDAAGRGDGAAVDQARLDLRDEDVPHVFREAAELAIRAGHITAAAPLLPYISPYWMADLVKIAAASGNAAHTARLIEGVTARVPEFRPYLPDNLIRTLDETSLRTEAAKAAIAAGHTQGALDMLGPHPRKDVLCKTATAAIISNHMEALRLLLDEIDREPEGPMPGLSLFLWGQKQAVSLTDQIDAAIEHDRDDALRQMLDRRTPAVISGYQLKNAAARPGNALPILLAANPLPSDCGLALETLMHATAGSTPLPIEERWLDPLFVGAHKVNRETAMYYLGMAEDGYAHIERLSLAHPELVDTEVLASALTGASVKNRAETVQKFLDKIPAKHRTEAFRRILGIQEDGYNSGVLSESLNLIPPLIASIDFDRQLLGAALPLVADYETGPSPASVAIINHPSFPREQADDLLIRLASCRNKTVIDALVVLGGNRHIPEFFEAAKAGEIETMQRLLSHIPDAAVQTAAERHAYHEDRKVVTLLIDRAPSKLDLAPLFNAAVQKSDPGFVLSLLDKGASVAATHFAIAARDKSISTPVMDILLAAPGGLAAAQAFLGELDADTDRRHSYWEDPVAYIRSKVAPTPDI